VPRPPVVADPSETLGSQIEGAADEKVAGEGVDASGDHRPDRNEQVVVLVIIEKAAGGARREDAADARHIGESEHRLLPRLDVVLRLVA